MRFYCFKNGLSLSHHGVAVADPLKGNAFLRKIGFISDKSSRVFSKDEMIDFRCSTEEDVFRSLGIPELYKEPQERVGSIFSRGQPLYRS